MAARPSITARAGLRPSHVELVLETTWDPVQCPETRVPVRKGVWSGLRWHHSLESGPGRDQSQVLGPVRTGAGTGSRASPRTGPQPGQDRSQDQVPELVPGPVPGPVLGIHFSCVRACPPGTIIDSNHFQLHPTPVPSAGGWDGRQRVGGFVYQISKAGLFEFVCEWVARLWTQKGAWPLSFLLYVVHGYMLHMSKNHLEVDSPFSELDCVALCCC